MSRALLFGFLLLAGCVSAVKKAQPVDLTNPGWTSKEGQITWQRKRNAAEISGDLLLALNKNGSALVRFSKDPITVVLAQMATNEWNIRFGQNYHFHGGAHRPAQLIWLYLPEILLDTNSPPKGWSRKITGLKSTALQNETTGERLEVFMP